MQPPLGVDALPQYYHLVLFNYGDRKARDMSNIMPDSIPGDN